MKVEELRIGNLVEAYIEPPVSEWVEIDVSLNTLLTITNKPETHGYRPIPLTEKWLLKFGFFGVNKSYFVHNKSKFLLEYTKDLNGDWYIMVNGSPRVYLQYIHQLQNLFFALTGEELKVKS